MKRLSLAATAALLMLPAFAAEGDRCLMASQVNGFSDAGRDGVTLSVGSKDFRVEFATSCIGLDSAITIAAVSAMTCFDVGDKIVFEDAAGFRQTCMASKVSYLPKDEKPEAEKAD